MKKKHIFIKSQTHDPLQNIYGNYTWRQHYGLKNLSKGAQGRFVCNLQRDLVSAGCITQIDGYFGIATKAALIDFQLKHNLPSDGILNLQTKELLIQYCTCI